MILQIKCVSPTDRITLHSKDLKIDEGKTTLTSLNQTNVSLSILETSQGAVDDFLTLKLVQTLQADRHYELELHFEGVLNETKLGYFRSSYLNEDDERIWLAVTYFKPNHARRAFPCFDEFTFKAKFTISLGRSIRHKSLSNMPLVKTEKM